MSITKMVLKWDELCVILLLSLLCQCVQVGVNFFFLSISQKSLRKPVIVSTALTSVLPWSYFTLFNPKSYLLESTFLLHFKSLMGAFGGPWVQ